MKTNILIPMAGEGKRFSEAGYTQPKPLIEVDKWKGHPVPMYKRVRSNLWTPYEPCMFIFVTNKAHGIRPVEQDDIVIEMDYTTDGPARTALSAQLFIDNNDHLVVANCDQIMHDYRQYDLRLFADTFKADVILGCFISTSPKNSYVRLNDEGQIIEVREKDVISNIATNGIHWFRRGSDFVRGAEKMIEADDRVNGEFYIAPSVNYLIAEGLKVMPFFFNLHFPIGTPEDLQKYEAIHAKIQD